MSDQPTRVFRNGSVFTADAAGSSATAIAVVGGSIAAVGGDDDVRPYIAYCDEVVDLDGRMLAPGFIDAHVHPVVGGLERVRCDLSEHDTWEDYHRIVGDYARSRPEASWILGGGWSMSAFPSGRPTRHMLDDVVATRPVALPNRDHHSSWVNSAALEIAGVDRHTPDPADGRIERDAAGTPTGLLHEGAMELVAKMIPADTDKDFEDGLRCALAYLHSVGITGWQDAIVQADSTAPGAHRAYLTAQADGWLTARVTGALWWDRSTADHDIATRVAELAATRSAAGGGEFYRVDTVKVMQDGVIETFTASLLEPYLDRCGHPTSNGGMSFLDADLVQRVTTALDAAGFNVHFHALGDRAVREVLDALAAARLHNGTSDRRHQLAHLQVVDTADIRRFRGLGAIANLQALWAAHEPQMDDLTIPFLGEPRAESQYPFGDLARAGATLAMGSDWPVSSPHPMLAIHTAVNRVAPGAPAGTPPLGTGQELTLPTAMRAYTAGSAFATSSDSLTGTIRTGAAADLVVLDRDPFLQPLDQIGDCGVDRTFVAGHQVFSSN